MSPIPPIRSHLINPYIRFVRILLEVYTGINQNRSRPCCGRYSPEGCRIDIRIGKPPLGLIQNIDRIGTQCESRIFANPYFLA